MTLDSDINVVTEVQTLDGASMEFQKSMQPTNQVSHLFVFHNINLGGAQEGYQFSTMFQNNKLVMRGNMNSKLALNGHCEIKNCGLQGLDLTIIPNLVGKDENNMVVIDADYRGTSGSFNAGSRLIPSIKSGNATKPIPAELALNMEWTSYYTQAITKNISAGASMLLGTVVMDPGMLMDPGVQTGKLERLGFSQMHLVGKYRSEDCVATVSADWPVDDTSRKLLGPPKARLGYVHKLKDQVQLGTDLAFGWDQQTGMPELKSKIAYKMDFLQSGYTIQGSVNSDGVVKSVLEAKLVPNMLTFTMSAELNHGPPPPMNKLQQQLAAIGHGTGQKTSKFGMSLQLMQ